MVDITKLRSKVEHYDKKHAKPEPDYDDNQRRLRKLVDDHGIVATSIATGFTDSTIKQHCRNGRAGMISSYRLERAESVLSEM